MEELVIEIISAGEFMNSKFFIENHPNNTVRSIVNEIVELSEQLIGDNREMSLKEFEKHVTDKYDFLTEAATRKLYSSAIFSTR